MATARSATTVPPPPWEVTSGAKTPGLGAVLRIGARAVPFAQICGVVGSFDRAKDRRPACLMLGLFGVIALGVLWGAVDLGWRERFLLGALVFGGIGLTALNDLTRESPAGIYRVEVLLVGGESLRYATVDPDDQERLLNTVGRYIFLPVSGAANALEGRDARPGSNWVRPSADASASVRSTVA